MGSVKLSVIGCGHWGKNLVRVFAELGALTSVWDTQENLALQASQAHGVPIQPFDEILESSIDGVVIAAPAAQHYSLAKRALEANKHVFVEKPLSLDVQDAQALCHLAKSRGRCLMVGHLLQYHPAFLELKRLISRGELGRLQYMYSNRLNLGKFRSEENILWSFAPHDISMILTLAGAQPTHVFATGSGYLNPSIHDVTTTHLSFKNGIQAHLFVSWLHPYKEQKLVVVGDGGMAVFDDGLSWGEKLKLYPHRVTWQDGLPQPEKADVCCVPLEVAEPLKLECQHFLTSIMGGTSPRTDGEEGLRVLKVLDAAQSSLLSKSAVPLDQRARDFFAHQNAIIDAEADIGAGTKIWHFSHVMKGAKIGRDTVIGQNVMVAPDVVVGNRCKIQNNVSLYKGVTLEDGVFCGPSCVFTNVHNPRAEIERKDEFRPTYVERGVTIGANATIICGNRLGAYSLIGAGAVITKDVKPHAVMVGNPAKQIGWVSHAGERLGEDLVCPREGRVYEIVDGNLIEIQANDKIPETA